MKSAHPPGRVDADVIVLGTGAWGATALWRLAASGADVLGVDQFPAPHDVGSSHGRTRLFRTVCLEHPGLTPVARRSLDLYRELEAATDSHIIDLCSGITIGPVGGRSVTGALAAARGAGSSPEVLDAIELQERFPVHTGIAPNDLGVIDNEAGVLHIESMVGAALTAAQAQGARLACTSVIEVARDPCGVRVETSEGTLRARRAIAALGSWSAGLFPTLPLKLTRMPMTWFSEPSGTTQEEFGLEQAGVFIREIGDGGGYWGHGTLTGGLAKVGPRGKVARGDEPSVASLDRRFSAADGFPARQAVRRYLPALSPKVAEGYICHSSRTPDEQFIVGALPENPAVIIAAGESGHGGKHAAGIGSIAADLALEKPADLEIDFMRPARFSAR